MSFNWAEYLSLAETLCGQLPSGPAVGAEAQQRASVSRAYYAAFALARNRLRDIDHILVPTTGKAHQFVISRFKNDRDPRRRTIGINLDRLRNARNSCDYWDVVGGLSSLAGRSLSNAAKVLSDLSGL